MNLLYKPLYEYNLIDTILVLGIMIIGTVLYYAVKLGIVTLRAYLKNRRK